MTAQQILKMIEECDPLDVEKMDEIDFSVTGYLGFNISACQAFTRSRDALKAIRPDGWFNYSAASHGICNFVLFKGDEKLESSDCKTEELAELHCIIQAIEYERTNKTNPQEDTMNKQQAISHCEKLVKHLSGFDSHSKDAIAIKVLLDNVSCFLAKKLDDAIEVYPHDLPRTMTYLDAVKEIEKLGDGWRIPTIEELRKMYKIKDVIGGFCTDDRGGSVSPGWYWSSTEDRDYPSYVHVVRFSEGGESWGHKNDHRLSVRPVRLVAVSSAPLPVGEEA